MKKRILSLLLILCMVVTFLNTAAFAVETTGTLSENSGKQQPSPEEQLDTAVGTPVRTPVAAAIYVKNDGSDTDGLGTKEAPFATLAKAVEHASNGATIYVMSNLTMTECARYYSKSLTITSDENGPYTVTRDNSFATQSDHARNCYNPAMIEVQTNGDKPAGLTLTKIILDDDGKHEGTVFAQAVSDDGTGTSGISGNTVYVQDAIIASNATVPSTITLGDGAVLRNFGGMSAVRITDQAQLVMAEGSIIEDTTVKDRTKGEVQGEVGPAGAIWIQGSSFTMNEGAVIRNIIGRAVYADGGTATVGGAINDIKPDKDMWQKTNGIAIHLRNQAIGTLDSTCSIDNQNTKVGGESIICSNACDLTVYDGAVIKNATQTKGIAALGTCRVDFDGEITGLVGNSNALNLQNGEFNVTLGKNANIHDNQTGYGTIYIQAQNGKLDIYGKINNNTASDRGGAIAMGNNFQYPTIVTMYDGAEICNNYSAQTGGGVMVSVGTFTMKGGTISNNLAKKMGGGVYVRRGGNFIMEGGTIVENTTAEYGGGIAYEAGDYNNGIPCVTLNGGTITGNTMSATIEKDSETGKMVTSGGVSNDISVLNKGNVFSHVNRYFYISDGATIGNKAVYFQANSKTVTPADDSLNIKLGNASQASVTALTTASTDKGWKSPLAAFWVSRDGAAALTIGGLALDLELPVYVLTQKTGDDGKPASSDAPINTYATAVDAVDTDGNVSFTLPTADVNGSGCAVAIVQPTHDFGRLTISVPETIKQNKTGEDHSVPHTVTFDMSESLSSMIVQARDRDKVVEYSLVITADDCLKGDRSFVDHSIDVTYTLPNDAFAVVDFLFASAELTVTVGEDHYVIPSNVTKTKLLGLESFQVVFVWNDGSSKTETMSVTEGEALGDRMIADPARSGYTFTGWNTQQDGKGSSFDNSTVITGPLTVYAQWSENSSGGGGDGFKTYYYYAIEKIDAQDGHTLSGAKFGLYLDGNQVATATSNRSGIALFRMDESDYRKITVGSELYYQELTAPAGYILNSDKIGIEKRDLTTSQTTAEKNAETVRNYQKNAPADLNGDDHVAYVHGYTDGTVKPSSNVTRAETAMMLYRLLTESRRNEIQTASNSFSDVSADDWYNESVSTMANGKYITGYPDGTFGGNKNITRAEFVAMLVRFIGVQNENCCFTDVSRDHWAYGCIATATKAGWIGGYADGTFKPEQPITRAEAMTIINRVLNRGVNEKSELMNFRVWPDNDPSAWYYYEVIEASNEHEYTGSRPSENWTSLRIH